MYTSYFLVQFIFEREVAEANVAYTYANPHFQLNIFFSSMTIFYFVL